MPSKCRLMINVRHQNTVLRVKRVLYSFLYYRRKEKPYISKSVEAVFYNLRLHFSGHIFCHLQGNILAKNVPLSNPSLKM